MQQLDQDQIDHVTGAKRLPVTTLAIGEEGGGCATTLAIGEEGGGATTKALGEEGPIFTTLAVGEEGGGGAVATTSGSAFGKF